jgi:hypothetical protein
VKLLGLRYQHSTKKRGALEDRVLLRTFNNYAEYPMNMHIIHSLLKITLYLRWFISLPWINYLNIAK